MFLSSQTSEASLQASRLLWWGERNWTEAEKSSRKKVGVFVLFCFQPFGYAELQQWRFCVYFVSLKEKKKMQSFIQASTGRPDS